MLKVGAKILLSRGMNRNGKGGSTKAMFYGGNRRKQCRKRAGSGVLNREKLTGRREGNERTGTISVGTLTGDEGRTKNEQKQATVGTRKIRMFYAGTH